MKPKRPDDMRYLSAIPRKEPLAERVLVHNHIQHTPEFLPGQNGFRAWTQIKTGDLVRCACRWAPEVTVHYRVKGIPRKKR